MASHSTLSSCNGQPTLASHLHLSDDLSDVNILGHANMTRCCTGDQYCKPVDEPPVILGSAHMMKTVPLPPLHGDTYKAVPTHTWIDVSLDEPPRGPDPIQIFTVHGEWKQWTVTTGRYLQGSMSNRCNIEYEIRGEEDVRFIEAWYCRHCGKLLEDCDEHEESP